MGELLTAAATLLVVFSPYIYSSVAKYLAARRAPPPAPTTQPVAERTPFIRALEALLAAHTCLVLFKLFCGRPANIFTDNGASLTTPPLPLRNILLTRLAQFETPTPEGSLQESYLSPELESLLSRLQSFEVRTSYVRFGHDAVQKCAYCLSFDDFWLFALPGLMLSYIRTLAVVGSLTAIGSGKRRFRWWAVGAVIGGFVLELWTLQTTDIRLTDDTVMLHDRLWLLRHLGFLAIPIVVYALPVAGHPLSPLLTLPQTLENVERTILTLRLMERTRLAGARSLPLRERATEWSEQERKISEWGYEDPQLMAEATKLGLEIGMDANAEQAGKMSLLQALCVGLGAPMPQQAPPT
ncbi:hypothetical protein BOTBODRAFT_37667 [Botryobasidium botryosum FD-172 SS1]|uniref:Uncharacterized protein n=1 Tax=Botryobasidium botryosum (strain FD-172 SS1) TaxID=930990 RepID=A0A067LZY8_BOTB1|nr:hypothetical protein BOTBODRAFT_37667 [Botryobasidium botryosum FD-172 SS1]